MQKILFLLPLILALLVSGTVEAKKKKYPNGDYYEGEWKKGQPDGFGKMIYANGDVYEGNWVLGKMEGQGVMTNQRENITYNGTWKNGLPNGNGTMYMKNFTYEGLWNEGKILEGKVTDPKRNVFEGTFLDGKTVKTGKMTYSNGNWCEGDWENNKLLNGKCKSVISDSLYFEGEVKNGLPFAGIGKGRIAKNYYDGKWENGEFTGHCILKECTDKISLFEGERKSDGCYNGKLKFEGGTYVGEVDSVFTKQGEGELYMDQYNYFLKGTWGNNILLNGNGSLSWNNSKVTFEIENMSNKKIAKISIDGKQTMEDALPSGINDINLAESIVDILILKERKEKQENFEKYFSGKVFYAKKLFSKYYSRLLNTPIFGSEFKNMFDENMAVIICIIPIDENKLLFVQRAKLENQPKSYNRGYLLQQNMLGKDLIEECIYNYTFDNGCLIFKSDNVFVGEKKYQITNNGLYDIDRETELSPCSRESLDKFLLSNIDVNIDKISKRAKNYSLPENTFMTSTELKAKYSTSLPNREPELEGDVDLKKFISQNLKYPTIAQENGISGKVIVKFIVTRDGNIKDINIAESSGDPFLDKEGLRVVKLLPKFKPGISNGQFVDMEMTLPFKFGLK